MRMLSSATSALFCVCVCVQCMSPQQLMSVCEAALQCDVLSVRVNALAILGITGSTLAKDEGSAETLQVNISAYCDCNL